MAGCSPSAEKSAASTDAADAEKPVEVSSEETVDIVVVGSGTAGTCAAVRAAEQGAKVLCLEKNGFLGGTSSMTEYMAGVNNPLQLENDGEVDKQEVFRALMEGSDWGPLSDVVWEFVDKSGETIQWMMDAGVQFTYSAEMVAMVPETRYTVLGSIDGNYDRNGKTILEPLRKFGEQFGENLEFRIECPVTNLVVEDGKVCGVYATAADGSTIKVNSKAVILASGGFANSKEYFERFMNRPFEEITFYGFEGRDGDALRMCEGLNARLQAPSCIDWAMGCIEDTVEFDEEINVWFAWNPLLYVNAKGKRFMDEGLALSMDTALRNIAIGSTGACYAIADENTVTAWDDMGAFDTGTGMTAGTLREAIENCKGVWKADTLEALAEAIDVDADALKASVDEWNGIGEGAADPVFGTTAEVASTAPITTGPFYAAKLKPGAYCTGGGLASNASFQVLDVDMNAIEGLYACGCDNGSLYYRDYPLGVFAALQQGSSATGGRLAAEDAVKRYLA